MRVGATQRRAAREAIGSILFIKEPQKNKQECRWRSAEYRGVEQGAGKVRTNKPQTSGEELQLAD